MSTFFPEVKEAIRYEGADSKNPLAFKYYDADRIVGGKTMKEQLNFSLAYWHTLKGSGADIFGAGTYKRPWLQKSNPLKNAEDTVYAAFEFLSKMGIPYYCFHDRDIAPEGETFTESCKNLEHIVAIAKKLQGETGSKLLWGTANLFSHPRYTHGGGTNPDAMTFAWACAQVKNAMDATLTLGGENYVFWGGREGYETLLNTNYVQEQDQLARFLHMAVDYKKKIGFKGMFLLEPKPHEPSAHQYDFDSATVLGFLRKYDLMDYFCLNIEANHATLAGHTFEHELTVAAADGKLGSVDANIGNPQLGWDTDQFPTNLYDAIKAMMVILKNGGLGKGGLNFDAKPRRGSTDTMDLFYAHIGAMDTFARGLLIADKIISDGELDAFVQERYSSFDSGFGADIMKAKSSFDILEKIVLENGEPEMKSGRQEMLENIINQYIK